MKKLKSKEPKLATLILTATSGVLLGAALGVTILLSKPVTVVSAQSAEETESSLGDYSASYTPGRVAGSESANLRSGTGRILRRSPGPVSFAEDEVNFFFDNVEFPPLEEGSGAKWGSFRARLVGDRIFGSWKLVIDPDGKPFEVLLLAEISFENTDAGPQLVLSDLRANSLPLPNVGGVLTAVIESRLAALPWPEEIVEMWQNVKAIQVESSKLITEVGIRQA